MDLVDKWRNKADELDRLADEEHDRDGGVGGSFYGALVHKGNVEAYRICADELEDWLNDMPEVD